MNAYYRKFAGILFALLIAMMPFAVQAKDINGPKESVPVTIQAALPGEVVPVGEVIQYRFVDNANLAEIIDWGTLKTAPIIAGKDGLMSHDVWYGYQSEPKAMQDAYGQAVGDWRSANCYAEGENPWNKDYLVYFVDEDGNTVLLGEGLTCDAQ